MFAQSCNSDDSASPAIDPNHSHYGSVPGRYANRIGNATFTVDGKTYHTQKNDGENTLHSGTNGWGYRTFNVTKVSKNSITFSMIDPDMSTGMPGTVYAWITYTLSAKKWSIKMEANSPEAKTRKFSQLNSTLHNPANVPPPALLLTQHTYWNLDAFANPSTDLIWNHTYYTPYSRRLLEPDPNMVPTGNIPKIPRGDINDFWSKPKALGTNMNDPNWTGNCGTGSGCAGYNNCWTIENKPRKESVVATLASKWSGIKVDIRTNQVGMQLYTCYWMGGMS